MSQRDRPTTGGGEVPGIAPGYAQHQIAKALTTSLEHDDEATRERARARIARWVSVLDGLFDGGLQAGSRTPVAGAPAWATLEVVTGGFATGALLAGGPLREHEKEWLRTRPISELQPGAESTPRAALHRYFLTDEGFGELAALLRSGGYELDVPEEGAFLVAVWLAQQGLGEEARDLLEGLTPHYSRLRFYPRPEANRHAGGSGVVLQDVGRTMESLSAVRRNRRVLAQKEAAEVWAPLYDHVVGLFLETVEDDWPCRHFAADWPERALKALADYDKLRQNHRLCGKPERKKETFAELRSLLRRCAEDRTGLSGREVGRLRLLLGRYTAKRGLPGSPGHRKARERELESAAGPTHFEIAQVLIVRLEAFPRNEGIDQLEAVEGAVTAEESFRAGLPAGTEIPGALRRKVERCLCDTVEVLVERGVVTSGETLARLLPQLVSGVRAAGIEDESLRRLYVSLYRAFRRRRSLLLLNLEKQVQLEELPWIAAIERFRRPSQSDREVARQTLEELAKLAVSAFPQAILPNRLVRELSALAKTAEIDLPLVEEVAADIFMGTFSPKFAKAARLAANLLEGSLYARYFAIDYGELRPKSGLFRPWSSVTVAAELGTDAFAELCRKRSGVSGRHRNAAVNGVILEQQQILTTQNLAALFGELRLTEALGSRLRELADRCFRWICRRLQVADETVHGPMIRVKNAAYAWRQMIFYLSLLPSSEVQLFLSEAESYLERQPEALRRRFRSTFQGLALAAGGVILDEEECERSGVRIFLGWSVKRHWLLEAPALLVPVLQ